MIEETTLQEPLSPDTNRNDPTYARKIFEKLLPNAEERQQIVALFVNLISVANENPQNWCVILHDNSITLNVGNYSYYLLWLRKQKVNAYWLTANGEEPEEAQDEFKSIPDSRSWSTLPDRFLMWQTRLQPHMEALIRYLNVNKSPLPPQGLSAKAHSPGILRYLEQEIGKKLPDPAYPLDSPLPIKTMPEHALNTILYGPPGTGKTFSTAKRAVEIIDGDVPAERDELMKRYRTLQKQGRIAFVTFHQSYSYEDFVEGIRPVMDDESAGSAPRYRIANGILKELALNALAAILRPVPSPVAARPTFAALWDALIARIEADPNYTIKGLGNSQYRLIQTEHGNLVGENILGRAQQPYNASRKKVEQAWNGISAGQKPTHNVLMEILKVGTHTNLIGAIIEALREIEQGVPVDTPAPEPTPNMKALAFLEDGEDSGWRLKPEEHWENFILIIDEINRGNISKILGELITLLEDDKRIGKTNELTVTLPYSREPFALPPNLYIIGTMNTADKSLALLDVALRRRFTFEELVPNFGLCDPPLAPEMLHVLNELNRRITLRKDRDHRIGHAFFMNVGMDTKAFDKAFAGKILPLLQEFFFNDWSGLQFVLNENEKDEGFLRLLGKPEETGVRNRWQWYTDLPKSELFSPLAQLKTNYKIGG